MIRNILLAATLSALALPAFAQKPTSDWVDHKGTWAYVYVRNDSQESLRLVEGTIYDCVEVGLGCGSTTTGVILRPGETLRIATVTSASETCTESIDDNGKRGGECQNRPPMSFKYNYFTEPYPKRPVAVQPQAPARPSTAGGGSSASSGQSERQKELARQTAIQQAAKDKKDKADAARRAEEQRAADAARAAEARRLEDQRAAQAAQEQAERAAIEREQQLAREKAEYDRRRAEYEEQQRRQEEQRAAAQAAEAARQEAARRRVEADIQALGEQSQRDQAAVRQLGDTLTELFLGSSDSGSDSYDRHAKRRGIHWNGYTWMLDEGYKWVHPYDDSSLDVRWAPGRPHSQEDHVFAGPREGQWKAEPGYVFVDPDDLFVIWQPGLPHSEAPNVIAGPTEGNWRPAAGYEWASRDEGDLSVRPK